MELKRFLMVLLVSGVLLVGCANQPVQKIEEQIKDRIEEIENHQAQDNDPLSNVVEQVEDTIETQLKEQENSPVVDQVEDAIEQKLADSSSSLVEENTELDEEQDVVEDTANTDTSVLDNSDASYVISPEMGYAYYYNQLNNSEKIVYREVLDSLLQFEQDVKVSTLDTNELEKVFNCVMNDHPELFYISGYSFVKHTLGTKLVQLDFSGCYTMTENEAKTYWGQVQNYANRCLEGAPISSDYDKVKYVYEYLIQHTDYRKDAPHNQDVLSVFLYGESVCQGYAKATQFLLNRLQVNTTLVAGTVQQGNHVWNLVHVGSNDYYVDTTWGDASYRVLDSSGQEIASKLPEINYDYLCVNTDMIQKTHCISDFMPMPVCNHLDDYYFVKEGMYFTKADSEGIKRLFDKAYEQGDSCVYIKCSDRNVMRSICAELVDNRGVFQYLRDSNQGVSYSINEESCLISFWL